MDFESDIEAMRQMMSINNKLAKSFLKRHQGNFQQAYSDYKIHLESELSKLMGIHVCLAQVYLEEVAYDFNIACDHLMADYALNTAWVLKTELDNYKKIVKIVEYVEHEEVLYGSTRKRIEEIAFTNEPLQSFLHLALWLECYQWEGYHQAILLESTPTFTKLLSRTLSMPLLARSVNKARQLAFDERLSSKGGGLRGKGHWMEGLYRNHAYSLQMHYFKNEFKLVCAKLIKYVHQNLAGFPSP